MIMWKDPIVAEVHKARSSYAKKLGNDLQRIADDLRKREQARAKSQPKPTAKRSRKRAA